MVTQLTAPFTLEGKEIAIQKEITAHYTAYFAKAVETRAWFPHRLPERDELRKHEHHASSLDPRIKSMALGFQGVESFVDDYVYAGIYGSGNSTTIKQGVYQWGIEERRHGQAFGIILTDSGLMTRAENDEFLDACAQDTWVFERQTGMEATAWSTPPYAVVQERHTRFNYTGFRRFLLAEYQRTGNPLCLAMARIVQKVEIDEGAHEANYRVLLEIYLRYRPDLAISAMRIALEQYKMPVVDFPHKEEFEQAIVAAGIFSMTQFGREIFRPAIRAMGLESRQAIKRAEATVFTLPENAVIRVKGKLPEEVDSDALIYDMTPQGAFVLSVA